MVATVSATEVDIIYAVSAVLGFAFILSLYFCFFYDFATKTSDHQITAADSHNSDTPLPTPVSKDLKKSVGKGLNSSGKGASVLGDIEGGQEKWIPELRKAKEDTPLLIDRKKVTSLSQSMIGTGGTVLTSADKLKSALSTGMEITLWTSKGPKRVKLSMKGKELRWDTLDTKESKRYKLDLENILFIYEGKSTKNLMSTNVSEKLCISLITQTNSLDIQLSSERDQVMFLKGFGEMIDLSRSNVKYFDA
jgi:hypothetical protein